MLMFNFPKNLQFVAGKIHHCKFFELFAKQTVLWGFCLDCFHHHSNLIKDKKGYITFTQNIHEKVFPKIERKEKQIKKAKTFGGKELARESLKKTTIQSLAWLLKVFPVYPKKKGEQHFLCVEKQQSFSFVENWRKLYWWIVLCLFYFGFYFWFKWKFNQNHTSIN